MSPCGASKHVGFPDRSREGADRCAPRQNGRLPCRAIRCFSGCIYGSSTGKHHQRDHWRIRSGRTAAHDRAVRTPGRVSDEAVHGMALCGAGGGGAAPQPVRHRARRCRDGAPRHRGRRASARDTPGATATRHDQPLGQLHRTGPAWAGAGHREIQRIGGSVAYTSMALHAGDFDGELLATAHGAAGGMLSSTMTLPTRIINGWSGIL